MRRTSATLRKPSLRWTAVTTAMSAAFNFTALVVCSIALTRKARPSVTWVRAWGAAALAWVPHFAVRFPLLRRLSVVSSCLPPAATSEGYLYPAPVRLSSPG
ncbi:MAG: hypothetical protein ACM3ZE_27925, partial [Myxococcales bacterium]